MKKYFSLSLLVVLFAVVVTGMIVNLTGYMNRRNVRVGKPARALTGAVLSKPEVLEPGTPEVPLSLKMQKHQHESVASLARITKTEISTGQGKAIDDDSDQSLETKEDDEGDQDGRLNWFYEQRAYPLTTLPRMARVHAIEHMEMEEQRIRRTLRRARSVNGVQILPDALGSWQSIGPQPIVQGQTFGSASVNVPVSGRVTAIALDPGYNGTSNTTVYVGGAQGGVWKSTDNGATWTAIFDSEPTLAIGSIAIDPNNSSTIFVGTGEPNFSGDSYYGAGVFKTTNGGTSWTQIQGPTTFGVDGNNNTVQVFAFMNVVIPRIVVDPTNSSTVYVVTNANSHTSGAAGGSGSQPIGQRGIWKSTDGGTNWTNLDPAGTNGANSGTDFLLDPLKPARLYAAIQGVGVFLFDGSKPSPTWQELTASPLPFVIPGNGSTFTRIILAAGPPISPSTESTIYAVVAKNDSSSILGIFRSTDVGVTWTQTTTTPASGQTNYNLAIAIDPTNSNTIYYATNANNSNNGGSVLRSTDGGQTFSDISTGDGSTGGLHADSHVLVIPPTNHNILFTGNDGGIWRTTNATASPVSWTDLNQNLSFTQFQGFGLHPTDPNTIIAGSQDNGTEIYNGQLGWNITQGGDGGFVLIDQSNPTIVYHTFFNQNNAGGSSAQIGPQISTNSGQIGTWHNKGCFGCSSGVQGNFNPSDRVGFYAPMALNTGFTGGSGNVIYFGTNRLYRSADQATTWTGLGASADGFGTDLAPTTGRLSAIAAFPFSNNSPGTEIVWVGTNNGLVQVTQNAGQLASATFTNVTASPLPNRFVTDIAVDPNNSQRAIVVYSGFNANTPSTTGHVFITNNLGASWTNISGNLPDVPVTSVAINPNVANVYYIGTDIGVFRTADGGTTWSALSSGMPKVAVFMLRYHNASKTLVAATHGRGMYKLDVSSDSSASADIAASLSATAGPVTIGTPILYTGTVTNNGPNDATNVTLDIPIPTGAILSNVNGTNLPGAVCSQAQAGFTGTLHCTFATLAAGTHSTGTFNLTVVSQGVTSLATTATVGSALSDPTPNNNSSTATTAISTSFVLPTTTGLSQTNVPQGGSTPITIDILGTGFTHNTQVLFNGGPRTTAFIHDQDVQATVTVADMASAGTITVAVSNPSPGGGTSNSQTFTVVSNKQNQTINFTAIPNHTFGDAAFTLTVSATSGLPVALSVPVGQTLVSLSGTQVTILGAGNVTIQADQAGNSSFNPAPSVQQSFTINKLNQTINFSTIPNQTFGGAPFNLNANATSGLAVSFSVTVGPTLVSLSGNQVTILGAGNVTIQASQAGNANVNAATPVSQSFTINKANQTINFTAIPNHTFGDAAFGLSATSSAGLPVSFSVTANPALVNLNGSTVTILGAGGPVTIQADQAGNANVNAAPSVPQSFTIAKGTATLTLNTPTQIADGTQKFASVTTSPANLTVVTITYNGLTTAPAAPGSYNVVASLNNANFQASNANGTMRIVGVSPTNTQAVNPGTSGTASVLPTVPGMTLNLTHTAGGVASNVTVGVFSGNPTDSVITDVGGGFTDGKITNPNAGDTAVLNYYYPNTITGSNETLLQLFFFNGTTWTPVKDGSGNPPTKTTADNPDGTVSGGKFTITLSSTSSPKVSDFTATNGLFFTASTVLSGDVSGDSQITVTDLVILANIIAGNINPTATQRQAADVFQDGQITIQDLVTLANFLAGNIHSLPVVPGPIANPGASNPELLSALMTPKSIWRSYTK